MSKINYDETLVTKILEELPGDLNQKAAGLARIYGVYDEVNRSLSDGGPYRGADIVSILTKSVEKKNNRKLPFEKENLESLVDYAEPQNISNLRVAYEIVKEIISKSVKYSIYGALPGRVQKKLAGKNGEEALDYSLYNMILDSAAGMTCFIYGIVNNPWISLPGGILSMTNFFRLVCKFDNEPCGSLLTTIPYYSVALPYRTMKYLTKSIKDKFISKKNELASKKIRIESLPELPSPEPQLQELPVEVGENEQTY